MARIIETGICGSAKLKRSVSERKTLKAVTNPDKAADSGADLASTEVILDHPNPKSGATKQLGHHIPKSVTLLGKASRTTSWKTC